MGTVQQTLSHETIFLMSAIQSHWHRMQKRALLQRLHDESSNEQLQNVD